MTKPPESAVEGYNIDVIGRNVLVTDGMKQYAINRIAKIDRFSARVTEVIIRMDIQKLEHRVDITLKVDHIKIASHASSGDMYASIDLAVDRIQNQLRKYRKRISEHQAKSLRVVDMNVNVYESPEEEALKEVNEDIEFQNQQDLIQRYAPHKVVNKETTPLKSLTIDEAIMKMELSEDLFLIFRSEEDQKLKVIYRRNDGNYAVIEAEA